MGAYNWLKAEINCCNCKQGFVEWLQIHFGWCRYDEYMMGQAIIWANDEEAKQVEKTLSKCGELRTLVQVGSKDWNHFAVSAGDYYMCQKCNAHGSILVIVENNIFQSATLVLEQIPYPKIVFKEQLEIVFSNCVANT